LPWFLNEWCEALQAGDQDVVARRALQDPKGHQVGTLA